LRVVTVPVRGAEGCCYSAHHQPVLDLFSIFVESVICDLPT
jgi:hypothetical protein